MRMKLQTMLPILSGLVLMTSCSATSSTSHSRELGTLSGTDQPEVLVACPERISNAVSVGDASAYVCKISVRNTSARRVCVGKKITWGMMHGPGDISGRVYSVQAEMLVPSPYQARPRIKGVGLSVHEDLSYQDLVGYELEHPCLRPGESMTITENLQGRVPATLGKYLLAWRYEHLGVPWNPEQNQDLWTGAIEVAVPLTVVE